MPDLARTRIAILGLGLMGGSLALALKGRCAAIDGADPDPAARELALHMGIVERCTADPAEILPEAGLVVLAAPVRAIIDLLRKLPGLYSGQAVVLDLGSTKAEIANAMSALPERFEPLGGHPMCGKERGSLAEADERLYQGAAFALTPVENTTEYASSLALELVEAVGAQPVWLDPETHDRWAAAVSHLPYLLSNSLAAVTPPEATALAGPGYRSTTRLAGSPENVMLDILRTNPENVLECLHHYQAHLQEVERLLAANDYDRLSELLGQGARKV